jgi:hypothetical protein
MQTNIQFIDREITSWGRCVNFEENDRKEWFCSIFIRISIAETGV